MNRNYTSRIGKQHIMTVLGRSLEKKSKAALQLSFSSRTPERKLISRAVGNLL